MIVVRPNACTPDSRRDPRRRASLLQPLAADGAAIVETLAEVPIQGLNPVKPNIMFTMDDSGSMGWDFLPDYVACVASGIAHCRDGSPVRRRDFGSPAAATRSANTIRRSAAPNYNGVYYDRRRPSYRAGKKADGTDLPCEGSDATCGAPWTSRLHQRIRRLPGRQHAAAPSDLTTGYPTTVWCWKSGPRPPAEKQTADSNGSVCRRNGRSLHQPPP